MKCPEAVLSTVEYSSTMLLAPSRLSCWGMTAGPGMLCPSTLQEVLGLYASTHAPRMQIDLPFQRGTRGVRTWRRVAAGSSAATAARVRGPAGCR